ncbi:D-Ala-D-Ala carboxypeptidase family metallohydrolase [Neisseria polysaccharea]|uniref:D-Ala-D-Ala carboxypeptidase family metallohydrolase n=1 Tax=Neisseria polysaccharea TaxID=489 RepID=UPI0027E1677B|nr:D-Ala-D-Ala carboxypeptidase family metallohydrolase [Neisseria polysaccharea]
MQITEHFSFKELTRSETARRLGLQNVPSAAEMANIQYTAEQLEKIRAYVGRGIVVTSCFRSERVNKAVGGSPTSAHRFGLAADCDAIGLTSLAFAKEIIKMRDEGKIKFDQLILEFPERGDGAWVHIGFRRNSPMRNQIMTATKKNGKTVYLPGLHV